MLTIIERHLNEIRTANIANYSVFASHLPKRFLSYHYVIVASILLMFFFLQSRHNKTRSFQSAKDKHKLNTLIKRLKLDKSCSKIPELPFLQVNLKATTKARSDTTHTPVHAASLFMTILIFVARSRDCICADV